MIIDTCVIFLRLINSLLVILSMFSFRLEHISIIAVLQENTTQKAYNNCVEIHNSTSLQYISMSNSNLHTSISIFAEILQNFYCGLLIGLWIGLVTTINYHHGQLHFHKAQMCGWVLIFVESSKRPSKLKFLWFDNQSRGVALHKR